ASIKTLNPESIVIQSQEEIVPPADIAKEKEEYGVPSSSFGTSEKSESAPKEYIDQKLEDLYTSDLPNHDTNNLKDWYYWDMGQIVHFYLNKTNKIMSPVLFAQVIPANELPECSKPNEKEYWQAEGYDDIDDEDEELEDLKDPNLMKKKISKPKKYKIRN
ncbi:hypothetical protein C1645_837376, partial [Glomus cerebriforme]